MNMRPLLPRPGPPVVPPSLSNNENVTPLAPKTLTACNECRQKKTKCDGDRPSCSKCRRAGATCLYASDSIIAQNALKRKFKDLQDTSDTLVELVNILRTRDQHDAQSVFERLRAGESVEALVRLIKQGDLLLQCRLTTGLQIRYSFPLLSSIPPCLEPETNPFTNSILYRKTFSDLNPPGAVLSGKNSSQDKDKKYDWPYHAAELVEPSIDTVRASQWTTVTDSDDLVRALLKAYFYYDFLSSPLFHKDAFVASLVAGRKTYCSSLLVNAILASACHCYHTPTSSTDFWSPRELIYQFMAEARRLWDREQSQNHITTVQAGAIIGYVLIYDGMDKIGFRYLQASIDMARDMGLFSPQGELVDQQKQAVISSTAWGLFCMQARQMFHNQQPPMLLEPPPAPMLDSSYRPYFCELWMLYPQAQSPTRVHHSLAFMAICNFSVILNNIVARCFGEGKNLGPITLSEALDFRDQLYMWQNALPEDLQPDRVVFPTHLKIYMQLFFIFLFLFGRFEDGEELFPKSRETEQDGFSAKAATAAAKTTLESLVHLYYARHSFEGCDTMMVAYFDFIGFTALKELGSLRGRERHSRLSTVVLCAKGLRDQSRHFYLAEVVFSILRDSMSPDDARQLKQIASIDNEEKRSRLMVEHVFSHYPLSAGLHDAMEQHRLDKLIKSYEVLDLEDNDVDGNDETIGPRPTDYIEEIEGTPNESRRPSSDF